MRMTATAALMQADVPSHVTSAFHDRLIDARIGLRDGIHAMLDVGAYAAFSDKRQTGSTPIVRKVNIQCGA